MRHASRQRDSAHTRWGAQEGTKFEVPLRVANMSKLVETMAEDGGAWRSARAPRWLALRRNHHADWR